MEFYTPSKPNNSIGSPLGFRPPAPSAFDGPASFRQDRRPPQAVFVSGNLNAARSSSAPAFRAQSFVQRPRPVSQPIYASGLHNNFWGVESHDRITRFDGLKRTQALCDTRVAGPTRERFFSEPKKKWVEHFV